MDYKGKGNRSYHRIAVAFKSEATDALGLSKRRDIENFLNLRVNSVRTRRVYTIDAELSDQELERIPFLFWQVSPDLGWVSYRAFQVFIIYEFIAVVDEKV